jgi:hypothetical protein
MSLKQKSTQTLRLEAGRVSDRDMEVGWGWCSIVTCLVRARVLTDRQMGVHLSPLCVRGVHRTVVPGKVLVASKEPISTHLIWKWMSRLRSETLWALKMPKKECRHSSMYSAPMSSLNPTRVLQDSDFFIGH